MYFLFIFFFKQKKADEMRSSDWSSDVCSSVLFAYTVAVVLQGAIWVREIVLGLIQRRAAEGHNETLSNAMGIIRLLISVALFAIAGIVILDNMGVNVTGLVAGLDRKSTRLNSSH